MIAIPPKGYWIDGTDHDEVQFDHRGVPVTPHGTWRAKFETDDTAKCYRRFFAGRVRRVLLYADRKRMLIGGGDSRRVIFVRVTLEFLLGELKGVEKNGVYI